MAPVAELRPLAGALAEAFPETGLWPLAYSFENHMNWGFHEQRDPRDPATIDVDEVMRLQWDAWEYSTWGPRPFAEVFPGLAEPSARPAGADDLDPFRFVPDNMAPERTRWSKRFSSHRNALD